MRIEKNKIIFFLITVSFCSSVIAQDSRNCAAVEDSIKNEFFSLYTKENYRPDIYFKVFFRNKQNDTCAYLTPKGNLFSYLSDVNHMDKDSIDNYIYNTVIRNKVILFDDSSVSDAYFIKLNSDTLNNINKLSLSEVLKRYFKFSEYEIDFFSFKKYIAAYLYDHYILMDDFFEVRSSLNLKTYQRVHWSGCFE